MSDYKGPMIIGGIVCVAFLWGYKGDSIDVHIAAITNSSQGTSKEVPTKDSGSSTGRAPSVTAKSQKPIGTAVRTKPASNVAPVAKPVSPRPVTAQVRPASNSGSEVIQAENYQNPYQRLMKSMKEKRKNKPANTKSKTIGSFANTMDSITSGEIQTTQKRRRNAYFDKLSQQLEELRGEQPDEAGTDQKLIPNANTVEAEKELEEAELLDDLPNEDLDEQLDEEEAEAIDELENAVDDLYELQN